MGLPFHIDHIWPVSANGETVEENLALSCSQCNGYKNNFTMGLDAHTGENVPLFNPRRQRWEDHFEWHRNGAEIVGLTTVGRATIDRLQMNNTFIIRARNVWIAGGWHPPDLLS